MDKNDKCNEYDDGLLCISENYYAWAKENCLKYCKFPPCGSTYISFRQFVGWPVYYTL